MKAIIDACHDGSLDGHPVVLISNNAESGALAIARNEAIPAYHLSSKTHPDIDVLDAVIAETLKQHDVDLVILAGYMKKIGPQVLTAYKNKIINIHPSLLPKFGGQGLYGLKVHEAVLAANERETGVTIHIVNDEYDKGKILSQYRIPIRPDDTAESLAIRVLEVEHAFYTESLQKIITGEITLPSS